MGTNGTDIAADLKLEEGMVRLPKPGSNQAPANLAGVTGDFALAPLVDKIAYGIARGLVVAMKELEDHIASETRKVGDSVDRRLDTLQATLGELSHFVTEQKSTNAAVQVQMQEFTAGLQEADTRRAADTAALREADSRQAADLETLQSETRASTQSITERIDGICRELGVHQEDITAIKATMCAFSARVDALVERLDRQADTVRSMCAAYSQRETELEQLVNGLSRLRAFPAPMPATGL